MIVLRNKEFSSKAQKARRAAWDKKVTEDIWGKQADDIKAKRVGRDSQKLNTVELDKKSGKARVNYENSKIQDLTERKSNEVLNAPKSVGIINGDRSAVAMRAKHQDIRKGTNLSTKILNKFEKNDAMREKAAKNLKKGKVILATSVAAGTAYGAKKLYDKKKKEDK